MDADRNREDMSVLWKAKLSAIRKKHNLTIEALAQLLPAKAELVADWENGKETPPSFLKRALHDLDQDLTIRALQGAERSPPIYRSGPMAPFLQKEAILIRPVDGTPAIGLCQRFSSDQPREETLGNARLLIAAYNAFELAGRVLGTNAVLFAESLADGGLAECWKGAIKN